MGNTIPTPSGGETASKTTAKTPEGEDLQDLNTLCRLHRWDTVEKYAPCFDSIHHTTLTAGNAPLHTAINQNAPLSVIKALITANPPSVTTQNKFGNTPLHFAAWKNKSPDSLAIARFILEYNPQSASVANNSGNLPLHHATNYKAPATMVQLIYKAFPQAISKENQKGQTPLDHALHRFGEQHKVVALLRGEVTRNYVYEQFGNQKNRREDGKKDATFAGDSVPPHPARKQEQTEDGVVYPSKVWSTIDLAS